MIIEVKIQTCTHCESTTLVRNGWTAYKSQRYLCKDCGKSRTKRNSKTEDIPLFTFLILKAFRERLSLRGILRIFRISWQKLYALFNAHVKGLPASRLAVRPTCRDDALEFDELCSFVGRKSSKRWLWVALSRKTRQVVAWIIGDRSSETFKRLLKRVPESYLRLQSYSDHWKAYKMLLNKGNHKMTDKDEGETCHVERWNCTLRQRMSRFVRRSLAFSKKERYHHMAVKLFVWFYNLNCINASTT
jgi:insertion element IS1 protein InsB